MQMFAYPWPLSPSDLAAYDQNVLWAQAERRPYQVTTDRVAGTVILRVFDPNDGDAPPSWEPPCSICGTVPQWHGPVGQWETCTCLNRSDR